MRQKKKVEDSKLEAEQEACVKCSKLQNGRHSSFEETETQSKQTTLSTLKSVLKRSASHKKDKVSKNPEKMVSKDVQIITKKTKNRVQFDESQNKYFEADYVILIHEEDYDLDDYYDEGSPFDDEDDDSYDDGMAGPKICCSNPNCNNMISLTNYPEYGYSSNLVDFKYARDDSKDHFDFSTHYYDLNYEEINQNLKKSSVKATNRCENEKCENCNNFFDFEVSKLNTGQDFSDQVTLSPPEGYKDGGSQYCPHHGLQFHNCVNDIGRDGAGGQGVQFQDGDKQSEEEEEEEEEEEVEEIQEFKQNDTATPEEEQINVNNIEEAENTMKEEDKPEKPKQRFIVETITMTTVTERRIVREASDSNAEESPVDNVTDLKRTGILKGGKLWKNSTEKPPGKSVNYNTEVVNFKGNEGPEEVDEATSYGELLDSGEEKTPEENELKTGFEEIKKPEEDLVSPESTELTLTFKLGQHLLVANSLKPNSAMRQLFPSPQFLSPPPLENSEDVETHKPIPPKQFLVTAESLRLFEEAKKSKILGNMNSEESGQSFIAIMPPIPKNEEDLSNSRINKTIERNSLRRSLIKYSFEFRNKRLLEKKKNENSLEERIRQLTCDIDDGEQQGEKKNDSEDDMPPRSSPQGEESTEPITSLSTDVKNMRLIEPAASPSSNTTTSSTYKRLTDLFSRKPNPSPVMEDINRNIKTETVQCDLVLNTPSGANNYTINPQGQRNPLGIVRTFPRMPLVSDSKKQFLSPLAPLTACVNADDKDRYRIIEGGGDKCQFPEDGRSEYSLQDIDDGLREADKKLGVQPDVIAETPQNETATDELTMFAQQGARRIEKLKKRYSAADDKSDDDDDYGFNKRPIVKGIKLQNSNSESQHAQSTQSGAVGCNTKATVTTATTTAHTSWPYYSQEKIDPKLRNVYPLRQEDGNHYAMYGNPQEFRGYPIVGNGNYVEYQAVGQQKVNYMSQGQQNVYSSTNTYYRCQPIRFGGPGYSELSNYQFRHPPHSPPPMRRLMTTPQPSPIPSEDGRIRNANAFGNRNSETYGYALGNDDNRPKVGLPEVGPNGIPPPADGVRKNSETIYHRRTVPSVHNPCLQMKFSPVNYHQGSVPTASIRFSASCSPHPVIDESNVIIERHYSTLPHPPGQNTVGVIRVGQGQQMIRVPVPYSSGTPVQVHLMAGRLGRCDSPQRPSSPQGAAKVPMQPYNQYLIAKGTQTAQSAVKTGPDGSALPAPAKTVDFEKQGKAIAEELQNRQKLALSRSLSQETNFAGALLTTSAEPNKMVPQERGVPEGAASSSVQDSQPPAVESPTAGPVSTAGNTIYYTMNV